MTPSTPHVKNKQRVYPFQYIQPRTSFNSRKNNPQIIQNNNYITLNKNQTIIKNFNNVLSGGINSRRNSNFKQQQTHKRSNSVMSVNENNSNSFMSRENSSHSAMNVYNSRMFSQSSPRKLSQTSSYSQKSLNNNLNFQYHGKYSQQQRVNMIPKTNKNITVSNSKVLGRSNSRQNLKVSIVKGDSDFIREKKREFSKSGPRKNSNFRSNSGWGMESQLGSTNFDYSKPYKSPDSFRNKVFGIEKESNSKGQPLSLANSKHFEGNKRESLLMKLKENQIDNIDFVNLDLGNRRNLLKNKQVSNYDNKNYFKKKSFGKAKEIVTERNRHKKYFTK